MQQTFEREKNGYSVEAVNRHMLTLTTQTNSLRQENEQLKANADTYETTLKKLSTILSQLKAQNDSDRLQLAKIMIDANTNATGIIEQAEQDAAKIRADATAEANKIKSAATREATDLKKKLDGEIAQLRLAFEKITDAIEHTRHKLMSTFTEVDASAKNATGLLHTWQQNAETAEAPITVPTPPVAAPPEAPAEQDRSWMKDISEMLKNVRGPDNIDFTFQPDLSQSEPDLYESDLVM